MSDDEAREEKELDLTFPDVVTKYKTAAEIVNNNVPQPFFAFLRLVKTLLVRDLIYYHVQRPFNWWYLSASPKLRLSSFPVSFDRPSTSDRDFNSGVCNSTNAVPFDDTGCHIDGFITVVAHTHVIQEGPVTGRAADVIVAANTAAEVALRLVRPGKKFTNLKYSRVEIDEV
ncbi:hypothetical protein ZIOFF_066290 [Zingiber officinale]|uniref:Uncharacterized protein n=1 Tax=Zingiber officinale TaxID=94328 RepID=A0A8J5EYG6_ZINOF|nr:hypothetical protein ZIOFF_066290 [Zingiber officinale]